MITTKPVITFEGPGATDLLKVEADGKIKLHNIDWKTTTDKWKVYDIKIVATMGAIVNKEFSY